VEDAVQRMQAIAKFPMGERHRLYELAERMRENPYQYAAVDAPDGGIIGCG